MEEITVTGIVLSAMPYREKDKLINIFTIELGKVTAVLKGVSASNSKLKFAGQPFCFAKFELTGNKDFFTIKGVELIDSFFDLTLDYENYLLASSLLEISSIILKPNILAESVFLTLIKTLQNIVYNKFDAKISVLKFYLTILNLIGYALNFDRCDECDMKFVGDIKFNISSGTFRCMACFGGIKIDRRDFMSLKIINNTDISRLNTVKIAQDSLNNCIKIIIQNLSERLNAKIKSIKFN